MEFSFIKFYNKVAISQRTYDKVRFWLYSYSSWPINQVRNVHPL